MTQRLIMMIAFQVTFGSVPEVTWHGIHNIEFKLVMKAMDYSFIVTRAGIIT